MATREGDVYPFALAVARSTFEAETPTLFNKSESGDLDEPTPEEPVM